MLIVSDVKSPSLAEIVSWSSLRSMLSQSKESDDRLKEKIDLLIQRLDSEKGKQLIQELDKKYPRKQ